MNAGNVRVDYLASVFLAGDVSCVSLGSTSIISPIECDYAVCVCHTCDCCVRLSTVFPNTLLLIRGNKVIYPDLHTCVCVCYLKLMHVK